MRRAIVLGGAGFVGSHLCERLVRDGWTVACIDSLITGAETNLSGLREEPNFSFRRQDIVDGLDVEGPVAAVLQLASPASPQDYLNHPVETLRVGSEGTFHALELATLKEARFLLASTSEVYGNPLVHPQPESYWGNVNPVGPRSVYDEAKRFSEALASSFAREGRTEVRIARIFNTYGPRMRRSDGRAVPNFIDQALRSEELTIHGDGTQSRSLCFVDDLVEGLLKLLDSDVEGPVNLGNPEEVTMLELAEEIRTLAGSQSKIRFVDRPIDDPDIRQPDITRARKELGWVPGVRREEGLKRTIEWARREWH